MRHQQVNVDYWAMAKGMLTYGLLTALVWIMMRLFGAVFTLPRRLRQQQDVIQERLAELQRRFPDLNITEEELKNAEKDLEEFLKEDEENTNKEVSDENSGTSKEIKPKSDNEHKAQTNTTETKADEEIKEDKKTN